MEVTSERASILKRELQCNSLLIAIKEGGILNDFSERGPFEALLVPIESVLSSTKLAPFLRLKRPKLCETSLENEAQEEQYLKKEQQQHQTQDTSINNINEHVKGNMECDEKMTANQKEENEQLTVSISEYYEMADVLKHFLKYHLIHFSRANDSCFTTAVGHRGEFSELLDSVQRYGRLDKSNVIADADPLLLDPSTSTLAENSCKSQVLSETHGPEHHNANANIYTVSNRNNSNNNNVNNSSNNNNSNWQQTQIAVAAQTLNSNDKCKVINNIVREYHPLRLQLYFIDNVLMEKSELAKVQHDLTAILQSEKLNKTQLQKQHEIFNHTTTTTTTTTSTTNTTNINNNCANMNTCINTDVNSSIHYNVSSNTSLVPQHNVISHVTKDVPSRVVSNLMSKISKQPILSSPPQVRKQRILFNPPPPSTSTSTSTSTATATATATSHKTKPLASLSKEISKTSLLHTSPTISLPITLKSNIPNNCAIHNESITTNTHQQEVNVDTKNINKNNDVSKKTRVTKGLDEKNIITSAATTSEKDIAITTKRAQDVNSYESDCEDDVVVINDFTPYVTKSKRQQEQHERHSHMQLNTHEYSQESIENYRRVVAIDNEVYYDEFAQLMIQRECEKLSHLVTGFVSRGQSEERAFQSNQPFVKLMTRCLREIRHVHYTDDLPHKQTVLAEGIEKYVTTKLYRFLFDVDVNERAQNEELQQHLSRLDHLTAEKLDALPEIENKYMWGQAMFELDAMNFFRTPRDKLRCGMRACEMLSLAVGEILTLRKQERRAQSCAATAAAEAHTNNSRELKEQIEKEKIGSERTNRSNAFNSNSNNNDNNNNNNNESSSLLELQITQTTTTNAATNTSNGGRDDTIYSNSNMIISPVANDHSSQESITIAFGADEFLPCFMLLVLRAKPLNYYQNIHFIDKYRTEWLRSDEESYCLANLLSAAEFWLNCNDKGEWQPQPSANAKKDKVVSTDITITNEKHNAKDARDNVSDDTTSTATTTVMTKSIASSSLAALPPAPILHEADLLPSVREVSAINKARRISNNPVNNNNNNNNNNNIDENDHNDESYCNHSSLSNATNLDEMPREELSPSCTNSFSVTESGNKLSNMAENNNATITTFHSAEMSPSPLTQTTLEEAAASASATAAAAAAGGSLTNTTSHSVINALFGWTSRTRVGSPLSRSSVKTDNDHHDETTAESGAVANRTAIPASLTHSENKLVQKSSPGWPLTSLLATTGTTTTTTTTTTEPTSAACVNSTSALSTDNNINSNNNYDAPLHLSHDNTANKSLLSASLPSLSSSSFLQSSSSPPVELPSENRLSKPSGGNKGLLGFDVMSMFKYTGNNVINNTNNSNTISNNNDNGNNNNNNNNNVLTHLFHSNDMEKSDSDNFYKNDATTAEQVKTTFTKASLENEATAAIEKTVSSSSTTSTCLSNATCKQETVTKLKNTINSTSSPTTSKDLSHMCKEQADKRKNVNKGVEQNTNITPTATTIHQLLVVEKKSFEELSIIELRRIVEEARRIANAESGLIAE